jgi:hypothetical protein
VKFPGMMNTPNPVAISMPQNTAVPITFCAPAHHVRRAAGGGPGRGDDAHRVFVARCRPIPVPHDARETARPAVPQPECSRVLAPGSAPGRREVTRGPGTMILVRHGIPHHSPRLDASLC